MSLSQTKLARTENALAATDLNVASAGERGNNIALNVIRTSRLLLSALT